MSSFCAEYGISRNTFYRLLARARDEGPAAVLEPRSRRPASSPARISDEAKQQAIGVRQALENSGLDHGPISVFEKMKSMGLEPPSVRSLSRIFRDCGIARLEPKKRPRASYRRFVYPAPNACWQIDATEYVLTRGRKCVIFQLLDDHSRLALASLVAWSENSQAAVQVVDKAIAIHGVPQRFLSDNGTALNPSRRGWDGKLVTHLKSLGVEPITGKPNKPTTQGKNERFHQTLFRWLDKQPLAETLTELQAQVEEFDHVYNTQRPHQGLPGRITPQQAWDATPIAEPPRPAPAPVEPVIPPAPPSPDKLLKVRGGGSICFNRTYFQIGSHHAGTYVRVVVDNSTIAFIHHHTGEVLIEHPVPTPGTRYVSSRRRPGPIR